MVHIVITAEIDKPFTISLPYRQWHTEYDSYSINQVTCRKTIDQYTQRFEFVARFYGEFKMTFFSGSDIRQVKVYVDDKLAEAKIKGLSWERYKNYKCTDNVRVFLVMPEFLTAEQDQRVRGFGFTYKPKEISIGRFYRGNVVMGNLYHIARLDFVSQIHIGKQDEEECQSTC